MLSTLNRAFETVIQITWQAGVLVMLILLVQWMFQRRLSPRWRCAMWGLLLIRLAMPVIPESNWSIHALLPAKPAPVQPAPAIPNAARFQVVAVASSPVVATIPSSPAYRVDWTSLIAGLWLIGVIIVVTRAMIASRRFRSRVQSTSEPVAAAVFHTVSEECRNLGLIRQPAVISTPAVSVPSVFGIFKPMLLLPPGIERTLSRVELRLVLLHELMHIKRQDIFVGLTLAAFNAIHWFNPLLWLAAARFRLDRELACDAAVLKGQNHSARQEYAGTILKILESFTPTRPPLAAVAVMESRSSIHHRLSAITRPAKGSLAIALGAIVSVAVIGCAAFTKPPQRESAEATTLLQMATRKERTELTTRSYSVQSIQHLLDQYDLFNLESPVFNVAKTPTTVPGHVPALPNPPPRAVARVPATQPRDPQTLVTNLMKYIEPTTWKSRGGAGTADVRDGQVVIQQSAPVHEKVQGMIQFVGRQIQIQTRFITYNKDSFDWERSHKDGWANYGELLLWARPLEDADVSQITLELQKSQTSTLLTAPRLTLFNGQSANVVVMSETAYVKDLVPGLGNDQLSFDPVIGIANSGVSLECTPTMSLDGQSVILNIKPKLQRLKALVPHPVSATWDEGKIAQAYVQVPVMDVLEFDRTFRVPNNRTLLIKAGSVVGQIERSGPLGSRHDPDVQNFYLLVTATIVNLGNQP